MFEMMPCPASDCALLVRKPWEGETVHCLCGQIVEGKKMVAVINTQMDFICFYCGKRKPYSVKHNKCSLSCDCEGRKDTDRRNEMAEKPKSILDGVPVEDNAFPLNKRLPIPSNPSVTPLDVISQCPQCGAPVYGKKVSTTTTPEVRYSCECRLPPKLDIQDSMLTK